MPWKQFPEGSNLPNPPPGVYQWWNPEDARGWFKVAADRTTDAERQRLGRAGWNAQRDALIAIWTALSNAYRSLALVATSDPAYVDAWAATMGVGGTLVRHNLDTAIHMLGVGPENYTYQPLPVAWLGPQSEAMFLCLNEDPRSGPGCDFSGIGSGCGLYGTTVQECETYNWNTVTWRPGPVLDGSSPGGGDGARALDVLMPPVWSFDIAQRIAQYATERGVAGVLLDTRASVLLANLRAAQRAGVPLGGLEAAAAANLASLEEARWNDPRIHAAAAALLSAASIAAAAGPYGAAVGAVLGLIAAVVQSLPGAVGYDPRTAPIYTPSTLDRSGTLTTPPTSPLTDIPAPPGGGLTRDPPAGFAPTEFHALVYVPGPGSIGISAENVPAGAASYQFELTSPDGVLHTVASATRLATFPAPTPGRYIGRVRAIMSDHTWRAGRTGAIDTTPPAAIDATDVLSVIGKTCPAWVVLTRPAQLAAVRVLPDVVAGRQSADSVITALTAHCFEAIRASGVDVTLPTAPPGSTPSGLTGVPAGIAALTRMGLTCKAWGDLTPVNRGKMVEMFGVSSAEIDGIAAACAAGYVPGGLPTTAPALWAALGSDCNRWRTLSSAEQYAALARVGAVTDAQQAAAWTTLDTACGPPSYDDGQGWIARMHVDCAVWRAAPAAQRDLAIQSRGVAAAADRARVLAAIERACANPPATVDAFAQAAISRNVLTCAAWLALDDASRLALAAGAGASAGDAPAVVTAISARLGCSVPAQGMSKLGTGIAVAAVGGALYELAKYFSAHRSAAR